MVPCVARTMSLLPVAGQELGADGVQAGAIELEPLLDAVVDVGRHVEGERGRAVIGDHDRRTGRRRSARRRWRPTRPECVAVDVAADQLADVGRADSGG